MKYDMTDNQRLKLKAFQYKRMLEEKRGHNYEYWNDEKHLKLLKRGYVMYEFGENGKTHRQWNHVIKEFSTTFETTAKRIVEKLRKEGNYARIICGYDKDVQKTRYYSVIYKKK